VPPVAERPARELAYMVGSYFLIDIPIRAIEETAIGWVREEAAEYFGINRPSLITVAVFFWNGVMPAIGVFLLMLFYHRGNLKRQTAPLLANVVVATTRSSERDGFLPFLTALVGIAYFSFASLHGFSESQNKQEQPAARPDSRVDDILRQLSAVARLVILQSCSQKLQEINTQHDLNVMTNDAEDQVLHPEKYDTSSRTGRTGSPLPRCQSSINQIERIWRGVTQIRR
jgi:hypothetical protein